MASWKLQLSASIIAALVSTSAFAPDFSVLLGNTKALQQQLEQETAGSARAAQAFGASLSAADRRDLQSACTALVANSADADAQGRLQELLTRYKDNSPAAVMRFCLDPTISQLRADLQASRQTLERITTSGGGAQANIDLQNRLQKQQQLEQMISNIMKAGHDTAKNAISNVR